MAAYRALPRMEGTEFQLSAWLYCIALNQVPVSGGGASMVTLVPFSSPPGSVEDTFDELGESYLESPDHFEEQVEQRDLMQRVLTSLPTHYAACLLDAEGFSYQEIAGSLEASLPAVRSRLSRAHQAFQQIYTQLNSIV